MPKPSANLAAPKGQDLPNMQPSNPGARTTAGTAFDTKTYVPVIDWSATAASVEQSRTASERRARLMESEDAHVRQAARGYAGPLSGSKQSDALLKNSRMG